ncbi:HNH endonuclease [Rugamonas rubra]|jgi:hypothetical protein|uniref:HNH endonuclease n=1 Tax=Rugamonas rubra TaxID=758825 RepID=A0A1I4TQ66_9BURK|nr:hypothetical protein [Rugamonas rubra]SFM78770.1 hypothetical protein SAMN02982985_05288 [Rugamonas rubra]
MLINIADVWNDAESEHKTYVNNIIAHFLEKDARKYKHLTSADFGSFLEANSTQFALGRPAALELIIASATVTQQSLSNSEKAAFLTDAKLVFDYATFSAKNSATWNAYKLCAKARYSICPYCQQSFSFTVQKPKGKGGAFRPTLDHYYPKGKYPYLALSLYNLVPSCYSCNSSLKTTKDFYTKKHLHPLSDTEEIKFSWDIDSYLQQRGTGKSNFELTLQFDKKNTAAKNSANTFLLHERFVGHKGMLELFVQTIQYWNENPILNPQVSKREFRFNFTEQHALGFDKANYKNEMLGKIKLDLYDALIQWNKAWKP